MGLKDVLEKMKLVEAEEQAERPVTPARSGTLEAAEAGGKPPVPARPSIGEIIRKIPAPPKLDERALPMLAGEEVPDFASIYSASGLTDPAHGFSAYKVLEILSSPDFAGLDARAKAAALSGFLRMNPSGPVPIADVIQDAVARDQALDRFEEFLRNKLESRREQLEQENAALQAEIDELSRRNQEKMEANRRTLEAERRRLADWQARKRIEERKLFDAVGPFVEQNPVSLGKGAETPSAPAPGNPKV